MSSWYSSPISLQSSICHYSAHRLIRRTKSKATLAPVPSLPVQTAANQSADTFLLTLPLPASYSAKAVVRSAWQRFKTLRVGLHYLAFQRFAIDRFYRLSRGRSYIYHHERRYQRPREMSKATELKKKIPDEVVQLETSLVLCFSFR